MTPFVQTRLVAYFTHQLRERTGLELSIGRVDFRLLETLVLEEVLLKGSGEDTLLFAGRLFVRLDSVNLIRSTFTVKELCFEKALFNYRIQRGQERSSSNLDILQKAFSREEESTTDTTSPRWQIPFSKIELRDCRVTYAEKGGGGVAYGINWTDVECREVYALLYGIDLAGGGVRTGVKGLRLKEKSGFTLHELSGDMYLDDTCLLVTNTLIRAGRSHLRLDTLAYEWVPGAGYWRNFVWKMNQRYLFSDAEVYFSDLAYFNATLLGMDNAIAGSGEIYNTVANLSGKNLELRIGNKSHLSASFRSDGLPRFLETRFEIELAEGEFSPAELREIYMPWLEEHYLYLPSIVDRYDTFRLAGHFSGTIDDFVVSARSATPGLGGEVNVTYRVDTTGGYRYAGDVHLERVNYALLSGQAFLGTGSFEGKFAGLQAGNTSFTLDGRASRLPVFNTELRQVQLAVRVAGDHYDIRTSVDNDTIRAGIALVYETRDSLASLRVGGEVDVRGWDTWAPALFAPGESLKACFSGDWQERGNSYCIDFRVAPLHYANARGSMLLDTIRFTHEMAGEHGSTVLKSGFLDCDVTGNYRDIQIEKLWNHLVYNYFPSYEHAIKQPPLRDLDVVCAVTLKDFNTLLPVIYPGLSLSNRATLLARYNGANGAIDVDFRADTLSWGEMQLARPKLRVTGDSAAIESVYTTEKLNYAPVGQLYNLRNTMKIRPDRVSNELTWNNWQRETYSGSLSADLSLLRYHDRHVAQVLVQPGVIIIGDSLWHVERSLILQERDNYFINNFEIRRGDQLFRLKGRIGENPHDTLLVQFENFELSDLNALLFSNRLSLFGKIDGQVRVQDLYNDRLIYADMELSRWGIDRDTLGVMNMRTYWDASDKLLHVNMANHLDHRVPLSASGHYNPSTNEVRLQAVLSAIEAHRITDHFPGLLGKSSGTVSGILNIEGPSGAPSLDGYIGFDNVTLPVEAINTTFTLNDRLEIKGSRVLFDRLHLQDAATNTVKGSGYYDLQEGNYDIGLQFKNFMILNAPVSREETLYGQLAITGRARIHNPDAVATIVADFKTNHGSRLFVPLGSTGLDDEYNFLHFINNTRPEARRGGSRRQSTSLAGHLALDIAVEVTNDLELQLIFDPTVGDILKSVGRGNLRFSLDKDNQVNLFGEYAIEQGDYLFTMGNLINKRFLLHPGGHITWNGTPANATIDVTALYPLRTSLGDLVQDAVSGWSASDYSAKVPVECTLHLTDNLLNPTVTFGIEFPSLDTRVRSTLQGILAGPDEINKQVFALLLMNRFYPMDAQDALLRDAGYQTGVATASEMLSRQFSRWLSRLSSNLDIGVAYRPGDQESNNEFEIALSTRIWDNRISISANGNVVEGAKASGQSPITGDFDVDVKLNAPGTLKLKAYSHTDTKITYNATETIQGVGLSYQENFDTLRELFRDYFGFFKRKKNNKQ
jgi:hypothetical protein